MTTPTSNWGFLLDRLQRQVRGISHAIAVSRDGLLIARTSHLGKDAADQLAAVTSGLVSLTDGAARLMGSDPVTQTIVESKGGYLIVMAIGDGSILTVLAGIDCDTGQVAFEMATLINEVGPVLTPATRCELA